MKRDIDEIMNYNITQTMNSFNFENRENLRQTASDILTKQNASPEVAKSIFDKAVLDFVPSNSENFINPQLSILKASFQISMNNDLKETLKYIKSQAYKKQEKTPVFGELWSLLNEEPLKYEGELLDFEIDSSAKNIFIAA